MARKLTIGRLRRSWYVGSMTVYFSFEYILEESAMLNEWIELSPIDWGRGRWGAVKKILRFYGGQDLL